MSNKKKIISLVVSIVVVCVCILGIYSYKTTGVFFGIVKKKLPIYYVDTQEKKIAISFDASWGADNTIKILDTLDKYDVKATFFLVGKWVETYPEEVKEIHKRGHEIGNHSNSHPDFTKISPEKMLQEINITSAKIMDITGEPTTLFRCPSGAYNDTVIDTVQSSKHYCIQWDVDSIDWKAQGADIEYERVMKKTKDGSIILFHNDAKYTPDNLPRVLESLLGQGYTFVTISDLIYKDDYYIDISGKQIKN